MIIAETVLISIGFLSLEVCKKYDYSRDGHHFYKKYDYNRDGPHFYWIPSQAGPKPAPGEARPGPSPSQAEPKPGLSSSQAWRGPAHEPRMNRA